MRKIADFIAILTLYGAVAGAVVLPVAQGDEDQVNSYTTVNQQLPVLAVDGQGRYVLVWSSNEGQRFGPSRLHAARFDADGTALAGEFEVTGLTSSGLGHPSVAAWPDGRFVVVWHATPSVLGDDNKSAIHGRLYDSGGTAATSEFLVNSWTTDYQYNPEVAVDPNGGFVVVWHASYTPPDSWGLGVFGRRFASDGTPLAGDFAVNTATEWHQGDPDVAVASDGTFMVVYSGDGSAGDSEYTGVMGHRYSSTGVALDSGFLVNTYTTFRQDTPVITTTADGGFAVAWHNGSNSDIRARRFASSGSPVGDDSQINDYDYQIQERPAITGHDDGGFTIVWASRNTGTADPNWSVQGRTFGSDGSSLGPEFQLNEYSTTYRQWYPAIGAGQGSEFIVAWQADDSTGSDSDGDSVHREHFTNTEAILLHDNGTNQADSTNVQDMSRYVVADDFEVQEESLLWAAEIDWRVYRLGDWPRVIEWWILDDSEGQPGGILAHGQAHNSGMSSQYLGQALGDEMWRILFRLNQEVAVFPGERYWFALHMAPAGDHALRWIRWTETSSPAEFNASMESDNGLFDNWTSTHGVDRAFKLYGTSQLLFAADFENGQLTGWSDAVP